MNTVSSLVESILSIYIMEHLADAYTISRCNNGFFIVFILIFRKRFLRPNVEWVFPIFDSIISIA